MRRHLSPTAVRVSAALGILGPTAYVAIWAIAGVVVEGHSPARDAISELAAEGSPSAPLMAAGFVVFGLAALPFAAAVRQVLPNRVDAPGGAAAGSAGARGGAAVDRRRTGRALSLAIALTGVATVGAAVFPCSSGCPGPRTSVTDDGHAIAATVGYLALVACPLLAARQTWRVPGWRGYAVSSAVVGIAAAVGMAAWAAGLAGTGAGGALQRAFNTAADVWWVATAVVVLRRADVPPHRRA